MRILSHMDETPQSAGEPAQPARTLDNGCYVNYHRQTGPSRETGRGRERRSGTRPALRHAANATRSAVADLQYRHPVAADRSVRARQRHALDSSLRNEHPIEWIAMKQRQPARLAGVLEGDWQALEP